MMYDLNYLQLPYNFTQYCILEGRFLRSFLRINSNGTLPAGDSVTNLEYYLKDQESRHLCPCILKYLTILSKISLLNPGVTL